MNTRPTFLLAALLAASASLRAEPEAFSPVTTASSGLVAGGVALFLPGAMTEQSMPVSLALLERPRISAPLPADWADRPQFQASTRRTRMVLSLAQGTSLYGTGEVSGPLLRNGRTIRLWNTDTPEYTVDGGMRLYQSHPWILGVRADGTAFGVIADTTWAAELSLEGSITFTSDGPAFAVLVIEKASPQEVVRTLASLTGRMPLPPRWALGYQQCRWSYYPAARVREVADQFRSRHIPCDVIWMDIDYMDGYRIFSFNLDGFGDPKALNAYLHERGFKSVWMIDPGVKADPSYAVYATGTAQDVWVHDAAGRDFKGSVWPGLCVFPDFTRPETRAWWATNYRSYMATGIDGVWNDMNEPSVFDGPGKTMPLDNWHRGGGGLPAGPHAQYHNVFGMLMVRATREAVAQINPDRRPFVLSRSNFLGGQRYAATWTGDNGSTEDFLRMAIPMSLNLGLSGQPFNGPDLGGFGENCSAELWQRWVSIGAFFPFCRGHACKGTNDKEPWAFGPAVEATARVALERRYRLMPYLYTLFYRSSVDGSPVMDPLFFADPKDPALRSEDRAFLLGEDLLVAPRSVSLHLPAGTWRTLSLIKGDTADPTQATLRVRDGAILPLGRVVESTAEESLDPLTLVVSLDASGRASGELYEDMGDGYAHMAGNYLLTRYTAERRQGKVVVSIAGHEGGRRRPARRVLVELLTDSGVFTAGGTDGQAIEIGVP